MILARYSIECVEKIGLSSQSTTSPVASDAGTSMVRWLLEPRKRSEMSYWSWTKGPSTRTSSVARMRSVFSRCHAPAVSYSQVWPEYIQMLFFG